MRVISNLTLLAAISLSVNAFADTFIYRKGTIRDVDMENDRFRVQIRTTGEIRTYAFPEKVNFIQNGDVLHDKSLVKPGQTVTLKFRLENREYPTPGLYTPGGELVMTGKVIRLNKSNRTGSLRLEQSNKIVPFRLAETIKNREIPRVGDHVVFTYTVNDVKVGME
jgi:hypothetical protein